MQTESKEKKRYEVALRETKSKKVCRTAQTHFRRKDCALQNARHYICTATDARHFEKDKFMRVGLIDVDSHNYINLPLAKLSAWHKSQGDTVEWYEPFKAMTEGVYDKVYCSKVFSFTQDYQFPIYANEVVKGGSGYCITLQNGREVFDKSKDIALPPP